MDTVRIDRLLPADSPRLNGEDGDHIQVLAESATALPPILVHRASMRVIDGMHRLRVAQQRGDFEVQVEYFDGTDLEAFVQAVNANVTHGLPLTLADRESAAARIIQSADNLSDRAIAQMTGLSAPTVARIRAHAVPGTPCETQSRIGRDGRIRPLDTSAGRQHAGELIVAEPKLSLREIARRAGISVGTARDVRRRLARGEDPVPAKFLPDTGVEAGTTRAPTTPLQVDRSYISDLHSLQKDPSLRMTGGGRFLLRWLSLHTISRDKRSNLIESLPTHSQSRIAQMAKFCSQWWAEFADELEKQEKRDTPKAGEAGGRTGPAAFPDRDASTVATTVPRSR